jgi:Tol biopolymer transport system component
VQILAIPSTGAGKRNLSRDLACNLDPVWSHDGEVAFFKIQGPKRGIALMQPDGSGQRFVIDGPASRLRWAPTGRRMLYFAEYGHPRVVDLDGGTDRDLAPVDSPEWSPDGSEIAGVSIRQLTIQRPDGSGLRTIATTRFVGGILGWSTSGAITFSASDGFIWTIRPDGSHERRITAGFSGTSSPDGSRLAVLRSVNTPSQVVVARADGSDVVVISEDGESVPTWSPDGNKIAFRAGMRLLIADASGGEQTVGPPIGSGHSTAAWSPDGRTILIQFDRDDQDVFGLDVRTGSMKPLLTGTRNEFSPVFSPDGARFLFSKNDDDGALYVARSDGRERRKLIAGSAVGGGAWSPDGSQIAYVSSSNQLHISRAQVGAAADKVIANDIAYAGVSWAPNGRRLVIANAANRALFTIRADGRGWKRIVRARPNTLVYWPRWSPHGDRISFMELDDCYLDECPGPPWLMIVAPSGRAKARLTKGGIAAWSPDGRFIAYSDAGIRLFDFRRRASRVLSSDWHASSPDWRPTCSLRGTRRNDLLRGTSRADLVCGMQGDDRILAGPGRDRLYGEQGDDLILALDGSFDVVGCGPGHDSVVADRRDLVGRDCERVTRR